ncbi:ABC transporter substrate-binding protein [Comamonas composti]|uniref:ABC transporter substrate-binding protein n=1 Tax=Comamonas composti TaxID=408558 RepID=UPI00042291DE|nr:ABC transporter substrate-binding protein [Comamonas composti]
MALLLGPGAALASPARPSSVTLNLALEPDSLDPSSTAAASAAQVSHYNLFEGLTRIEENGSITPLLAERWSQSPNGRDYVFHLRPGVRFHDGSAFNAAAVRFSFERARAPGSVNKARKPLFENIAQLSTPDEHTVALSLHRSDSFFLFRLGEAPAVILHPDSAATAASRPVGTGPFRLARWDSGLNIALEKVPGHWRAPAMDRANFRFISHAAQQMQALESGEIDLFFNFATLSLSRFQGDARYQVLVGASGGKGMLALNNRRSPLNDVRVRRAIAHAIDREAFIAKVLEGRGTAIGSHFAPSEPGYVHLAHMYPYDPVRARALLQQAGVTTPLRLDLSLPPTPYARAGGPVVAKDLAEVGILVRQAPMSWKQWMESCFRGHFDMTLINHVEPHDIDIYADPDYYFGYDSPSFRSLLALHARTENPRQRQLLFARLQRQLAEDAVNAWIFVPQISTVVRKGLQGAWMNYPIFAHDVAAMRWG